MIGILFTITPARTKEWNSPRPCQPHYLTYPSPLLVIRQGNGARPTPAWAAEKMCPSPVVYTSSPSLHFWPLGRPASFASRHLPFLRFLREEHRITCIITWLHRADLRAYPMSSLLEMISKRPHQILIYEFTLDKRRCKPREKLVPE
ncbi:hypothetical protein CKAH01_00679 [Colletotrichum kahawae]|uniref:Uncharacterized protein n=1 Tax=Colletotrichum kahawae TaxID=34407 RepID=A0AAE0D925_COLKA|nr:hypothetical protein CKAH01_00679 [Colletotrichum kahawae]